HIAFRRRAKAAGAWSLVAMIGIMFVLTYGVAQTKRVITLSPPEDYSLSDGVATIKFSQINDGHLHRFQYKAKDGTVMRFIIIKKNGGAYGVGLDACDNCGDAGYYEKDGKIICKKCDVAINLATIGFKGGCNPVPFDYQVESGKIVIQTSTLDALSTHFQ
ncbi:Fe-S-containing protein, partial [Bifidobacterium catenulatum]